MMMGKTVAEFIAYAKANPGKINLASAGIASTIHMGGELFKMMAGVDMVNVPYRSTGPALTDIIGGQVQVMFAPLSPAIQHIRAGTLRALAVTTIKRSQAAKDIPTIDESGVRGYDANAWFGVFAPAGTPAAAINRLHAEISRIVQVPQVHERFLALGAEPVGSTPEQFAGFYRNEVAKWAKLVRESGAQVD